jgi:diguanylate cyclase (GGDEF)-like protein/PAS domain S-box-containing protein
MIVAPNQQVANGWRLLAAVGWCSINSFWMHFAISLTMEKGWNSRTRKLIYLLYLPTIYFFWFTSTYNPSLVMRRLQYAWFDLYPSNFNENLYTAYYVIIMLTSLVMIGRWGKRSKFTREKLQAKTILITSSATLVLATITDTILPMIGIITFPFGILTLVVALGGAFYSISRYRMMKVEIAAASDYMFKAVNNPVLIVGEDSVIKDANDAALKVTGYSLPELGARSVDMLFDMITNGKAVSNLETRLKKQDGTKLDYVASGSAIVDEFQDTLGIVIILHDISERVKAARLLEGYSQQLEEKIKERTIKIQEANQELLKEIERRKSYETRIHYMGYHDELTGLPNRRYLNETIADLIQGAVSNRSTFAVIFLDFDNFKLVNDSFGHQKGDMLLKHYASCMNDVISDDVFLARIGGDEFLILLGCSEKIGIEQDIAVLSQKLMSVFDKPFVIDNTEIFLTTSLGAAIYPQDGIDAETLLANADIAMYDAKGSGKNTLRIFSSEIKQQVIVNNSIRNGLFRALENKELFLCYQPQINLDSKAITGVEALMRWQRQHQDLVPPSTFIPIAEETGLMVPMGYWALETACRSLKRWHLKGITKCTMAVNVSEIQLNQPDFVRRVKDIIDKTGLEPGDLELELTERIASTENEVAKNNLKGLRETGIRLSIDDFGTEYSSFISLKTLSVDQIKISMDFIQEINRNQRNTLIVDSIIELAHRLGLDVVAEGVETAEQAEYLRRKQCDLAQGYLFFKPMLASDIEAMLPSWQQYLSENEFQTLSRVAQ